MMHLRGAGGALGAAPRRTRPCARAPPRRGPRGGPRPPRPRPPPAPPAPRSRAGRRTPPPRPPGLLLQGQLLVDRGLFFRCYLPQHFLRFPRICKQNTLTMICEKKCDFPQCCQNSVKCSMEKNEKSQLNFLLKFPQKKSTNTYGMTQEAVMFDHGTVQKRINIVELKNVEKMLKN